MKAEINKKEIEKINGNQKLFFGKRSTKSQILDRLTKRGNHHAHTNL